MGTRLNPAAARQKFYAPRLPAGCLGVCFYNHSSRDLSETDQIILIETATRLWGNAPYMRFLDSPVQVLVWVDFTDRVLQVGLMLLDQTPVGYIENQDYDGVTGIIATMVEHAASFLERDDNIPADKLNLDDSSLVLGGIYEVARHTSAAMTLRGSGRTGREPGEN
jgi:hypothetical protein